MWGKDLFCHVIEIQIIFVLLNNSTIKKTYNLLYFDINNQIKTININSGELSPPTPRPIKSMDFRGVLSPTGAEPSPGKKTKCKPPPGLLTTPLIYTKLPYKAEQQNMYVFACMFVTVSIKKLFLKCSQNIG